MGESPSKRAFNSQHVPKTSVINNDGLVDSIRHLLFTDNVTKPYSHENILIQLPPKFSYQNVCCPNVHCQLQKCLATYMATTVALAEITWSAGNSKLLFQNKILSW